MTSRLVMFGSYNRWANERLYDAAANGEAPNVARSPSGLNWRRNGATSRP